MSGKHSNDQRYVDVYDSVLKLIAECKNFVNSDEALQYTKYFANSMVKEDFYTVQVKTHRNSGMTTTAIRLLKKDPSNILITRDTYGVEQILRDNVFDQKPIIFSADHVDHNFEYKFKCMFTGTQNLFKPEFIIFDMYSYIKQYDLDRIMQILNFWCDRSDIKPIFVKLG